jgi:hypothetical protein
MVFIGLEVGEGNFEDSAFQGVVGIFETGRAIDQGLADSKKKSVSEEGYHVHCHSYSRTLKVEGACTVSVFVTFFEPHLSHTLTENQSFRVNGS